MSNILQRLHPLHLTYLFADPHSNENNLDRLFAALSKIDSVDRKWMIGFVKEAVGTTEIDSDDDDDAKLDAFQKRCDELVDLGVADFFLAHGIILYVCNLLRTQGDPEFARANRDWISRAAAYFSERATTGEVPREFAEKTARMAEERINNSSADTQMFRNRYNQFCETVVRSLLPPQLHGDYA
jgi:hypothetical protein